jgi:hypothetical protein
VTYDTIAAILRQEPTVMSVDDPVVAYYDELERELRQSQNVEIASDPVGNYLICSELARTASAMAEKASEVRERASMDGCKPEEVCNNLVGNSFMRWVYLSYVGMEVAQMNVDDIVEAATLALGYEQGNDYPDRWELDEMRLQLVASVFRACTYG